MPRGALGNQGLLQLLPQVLFLMRVGHPEIAFEEHMPAAPIQVPFDRRLLAQAVTNIVKNAAEGIAERTGEEGFKGMISVTVTVTGKNVTIDVIDNGKGFPKENRQRLLEPYMTTRVEGTGLGLPIVAKILVDHDGGLELRDAPSGCGAWVRLFFPLERHPTTDKQDKVTETAIAAGAKTGG